jgi:hypothetical protein
MRKTVSSITLAYPCGEFVVAAFWSMFCRLLLVTDSSRNVFSCCLDVFSESRLPNLATLNTARCLESRQKPKVPCRLLKILYRPSWPLLRPLHRRLLHHCRPNRSITHIVVATTDTLHHSYSLRYITGECRGHGIILSFRKRFVFRPPNVTVTHTTRQTNIKTKALLEP